MSRAVCVRLLRFTATRVEVDPQRARGRRRRHHTLVMLSLARRVVVSSVLALVSHSPSAPAIAASDPEGSVFFPATDRTVAIGDLHGDCQAFVRVLRLAKLIDQNGNWVGGDTTLVQIGDVLDRGDEEPQILELLRKLKPQAQSAGGRVITMLGNHEIMNACGIGQPSDAGITAFGDDRIAAFRPGSPLALEFSTWPVACIVGTTLFCHAGITSATGLKSRADIVEANAVARQWLQGDPGRPIILRPPPPLLFPVGGARSSPLWTRELSSPPDAEPSEPRACADLGATLRALGAERLVVGHTVQSAINAACDGRVYRIDVGLSRAMTAARPQALEITADGRVRTLQ